MSQRRDLEAKLQVQKNEMTEKLEKMKADLSQKILDHDNITEEKKILEEELRKQLMDVEDKMGREVGGKVIELNKSENELKILNARIVERDEDSLRLKNLLKEKSDFISELEKNQMKLKSDVQMLRDDLQKNILSGTVEHSYMNTFINVKKFIHIFILTHSNSSCSLIYSILIRLQKMFHDGFCFFLFFQFDYSGLLITQSQLISILISIFISI